jgi:hypothetical protein
MFPTRRTVKRVLTNREGEEVERGESSTLWQVTTGKKKTTKKAKKGAAKKKHSKK